MAERTVTPFEKARDECAEKFVKDMYPMDDFSKINGTDYRRLDAVKDFKSGADFGYNFARTIDKTDHRYHPAIDLIEKQEKRIAELEESNEYLKHELDKLRPQYANEVTRVRELEAALEMCWRYLGWDHIIDAVPKPPTSSECLIAVGEALRKRRANE